MARMCVDFGWRERASRRMGAAPTMPVEGSKTEKPGHDRRRLPLHLALRRWQLLRRHGAVRLGGSPSTTQELSAATRPSGGL